VAAALQYKYHQQHNTQRNDFFSAHHCGLTKDKARDYKPGLFIRTGGIAMKTNLFALIERHYP
jgi:hypothetical protein